MASAEGLLGRHGERERVRALLGHARNGRGGALLVTGEPGIGKTTLLDATTSDQAGLRLLRVDGFEAESMIPFAGVQRLAIPLRGYLSQLPESHRHALRVAAGVAEGEPPDRFLVGLGVLGLLGAAGEVEPVLCVIDDAHLLDPESLDVLGLVARRLGAESVALVLAGRDTAHLATQLAGVPGLPLAGLETESALRLLSASLPEPIDPAAAAQVIAATGANPLALVDLARELSARRLTEVSLADEPLPIGHHLEALYLRRIRHLAADLQTWLLIAAADSTGNIDLIRAAGQSWGLPDDPVEEAESEGLVELGPTIRFRHPLVRSAAYNAVQGSQRRRAHRALSVAAEQLGLVEVAAWHAAKATLGTDADVADRLERVADAAGRRGGLASRARVLAQASELTPPGRVKYARLVDAAEAALGSGAAQLAKTYLDDVDEDALDAVSRGRLVWIRASISLFTADPALMEAGATMLSAAECFHGHDAALEQEALIKAFEYTLPAERFAQGLTLSELGARLRKGAELREGTASTILRGLSAHILLPYDQAVPVMRTAVETILDLDAPGLLQYGATSVALTTALWDAPARRECLARTAAAARDAGALQLLDTTLWIMSLAELSGGTPRHAHEYIEQVRELRRAIGYDAEHVINVALLAWADAPRAQVEMIAEAPARWASTACGRPARPPWRCVTWPRATTTGAPQARAVGGRSLPAGHTAAAARLRRGGVPERARARGDGARPAPGGDWRRSTARRGPRGWRTARARWSRRTPSRTTERRSRPWPRATCPSSWAAPTCCTASGCVAPSAAVTPGSSSTRPSTSSSAARLRPSPTAPAPSSPPSATRPPRLACATRWTSPPSSSPSRASRPRAAPTPRSGRRCS